MNIGPLYTSFHSPIETRFALPPSATSQEFDLQLKERVKTIAWLILGVCATHATPALAQISSLGFFAGLVCSEKMASAARKINTFLWYGGLLSIFGASYLGFVTWPIILPPATFLIGGTFGAYAYEQARALEASNSLLPKSLQDILDLGYGCYDLYQEYYALGLGLLEYSGGVLSRLWNAAIPPKMD